MPFDGTDYRGPIRPERSPFSDRLVTAAVLIFALILVMMPITVGALLNLVAYLHQV